MERSIRELVQKEQETCWLFVYGTLKRGNRRSLDKMYKDVKFLIEIILCDYTLYKMPFRNVPVMVPAPGKKVVGELWKIPVSLLDTLDKREGVAKGWYTRRRMGAFYVYLWEHTTLFFRHLGERF